MNETRDRERQSDDIGDPDPRAGHTNPDRTARQIILLVEDAEADRDVYGGLLWYNGYDVVHVSDAAAALARVPEVRPDLILLDIVLPGDMDGLELARVLRAGGLKVPIIALSAHSADEFGDRVEESGVDLYMEKPVDPFVVVKEAIRRIGLARP